MDLSYYGAHRVLEPKGILPQPAWKIDNSMEISDNELLIEVETLNIDSASFTQIRRKAADDLEIMEQIMLDIVQRRGKHHNPETGSGGMLIGEVLAIGKNYPDRTVKVGDKIATLVSLSLTPLVIEKVLNIDLDKDQVDIKGQAVLFASGVYAKLPEDMPKKLALSVLDVAGAPAQTRRLVKSGQRVVVLGASGKSGLLCLYEARKKVGPEGKVIAICHSKQGEQNIKDLGFADKIIRTDATDALVSYQKYMEASNNKLADLVINCVNIPGTEMTTILMTKEGGIVYFFSMATSFTKAALGAEGIGKDIQMIVGNGYCKNHADTALELLRESTELREFYEKKYS